MGPEQTEICIHALKATIPSKDFAFENPFVDVMYCTIWYTEYFSPLQVKNKPREGASILMPVSMLRKCTQKRFVVTCVRKLNVTSCSGIS
jgi:hypothetical protein